MAVIDGDGNGNTLEGTVDDDVLNGLGGNDTLDGLDGDDQLFGGDGNDLLIANNGDELLDGGDGFDTARFSFRGQGFTFFLAASGSAVSADTLQTYTLVDIDGVIGTAFDDSFSVDTAFIGDNGDAFAQFQGGAGDDTITGNDDVTVRALYNDATGGVSVDLETGVAVGIGGDNGIGEDTLINVHDVNGSNFDDIIRGTDNTPGPFGRESFRPNFGSDDIDGRGGVDRLDYRGTNGVVVDMAAGTATKNGTSDSDTFANIENLRGSDTNDVLLGDDAANVIEGRSGDDRIDARGGDDLIDGDDGFDTGDWRSRGQGFNFVLDGFNNTAVSDDNAETDTFRQIESLIATDFGDEFTVESSFSADEGNFVSIRLGAGNDTITNNGAAVRVDYTSASDGVTVDLGAGTGESTAGGDAAGVGVDTLSDVHRVRGSGFDDILTGSDSGGAFEEFDGRAGDDVIDGVGGTNNQARYAFSPNRVVVDLSANEASEDGRGGSDQLFNIQHIRATDHDDILTGDSASNFFRPGAGDDTVTGGDGFDTGDYRFDSSSPITFTLSSTVTAVGASIGTDTFFEVERFKGGSGDDTFTADLDFVGSLGNTDGIVLAFNAFEGRQGDDTINGNGLTRIEYFGAAEGIDADFIRGTVIGGSNVGTDTISGVSSIAGSGFDDVLNGSDDDPFNDRFSVEDFLPGAGDDIVDGRGGNDRLNYSSSNNGMGVTVDLTINTVTDGFGDTDTFFNIEGVRGSDFVDNLSGDDGDNNFEPDNADDVIDGRGGDDVIVYDNQFGAVNVDLANGTADDGEGGTDTLISIEQAVGSPFDDILTGSTADNILIGRSGADMINGGDGDDLLEGSEGDDILDGGAGADEMDGGLGDDTFTVDDAGDVLSEDGGTDTVIASVAFNLSGGFENLEFTADAGDVDGNGNSLANEITGSNGANVIKAGGDDDVVEGLAGDDTLNGQSGDDILRGGDGLDFLTGKIGDDMLFGGADNDQLRGEEGDDHMEGGGAKDRIIGKAGVDTIIGDEANDKLFGNSGDDLITGGVGKDSMNGGAGADTYFLAPGSQVDTIKDFTPGEDLLDISAFGFADFDAVDAVMRDKNGRAQINLDGSRDVVRLNGVLEADLSEGDFILF